MKTLGNILWHFPFFGFVTASFYWLLGALLTATVVAAPIGIGLMEFGKFLFVPFGRAMVKKSVLEGEVKIEENKYWKSYSSIIMILYLPFGLIFAIASIIQIFLLCITLVGIPVAIVVAKSLGTVFNPVNKKCIDITIRDELERREASSAVDKMLHG